MRLIVMRHAKSDWTSPAEGDHSRPLNARGRSSAKALGAWLREMDELPDLVLCSTSARTRETLELLAIPAECSFERRLYLANEEMIWDLLSEQSAQHILLIAHNPGLATFAENAVRSAPDHPRFLDYPTGATTIIEFEAESWAKTTKGTGIACAFVVPRELPGQ